MHSSRPSAVQVEVPPSHGMRVRQPASERARKLAAVFATEAMEFAQMKAAGRLFGFFFLFFFSYIFAASDASAKRSGGSKS